MYLDHMSTKIYFAWRCKDNCFDRFLQSIREHCFAIARKKLNQLSNHVSQQVVVDEYVKDKKCTLNGFIRTHGRRIRLYHAIYDVTLESYSSRRSDFCIDLALNVFYYNKYFYVVPVGESYMFAGLKLVDGVENYEYYNNTDKPRNISTRQWAKRASIWDELIRNWDAFRMVHTIIECKTGIGVYEITEGLVRDAHRWAVYLGCKDAVFNKS